jgi:hypothetical protein
MANTEIRSGQVRDKTILIQDLSDFAATKRTTTLVVDINAGRIRNDNTITDVSATTTTVTDSTTSYIEIDNTGSVSNNTTGFTAGRIPIATAVASGGNVTTVTDKRTWVIVDNTGTSNTDSLKHYIAGLMGA